MDEWGPGLVVERGCAEVGHGVGGCPAPRTRGAAAALVGIDLGQEALTGCVQRAASPSLVPGHAPALPRSPAWFLGTRTARHQNVELMVSPVVFNHIRSWERSPTQQNPPGLWDRELAPKKVAGVVAS